MTDHSVSQELTLNEMDEVSGGFFMAALAYLAAEAIDGIREHRQSVCDMAVSLGK
jgi:hypothetical protein